MDELDSIFLLPLNLLFPGNKSVPLHHVPQLHLHLCVLADNVVEDALDLMTMGAPSLAAAEFLDIAEKKQPFHKFRISFCVHQNFHFVHLALLRSP